jgi:hypothetical protein
MPEYPESSPNGILHIIDVRGRTRAEVEAMHGDVSNCFITSCEPVVN